MSDVLIEYDPEARATYVRLVEVEEPTGLVGDEVGDLIVVDRRGDEILGVELLVSPVEVTAEMIEALNKTEHGLGDRVAAALVGVGYRAA